ncbi:MAG: hypothetical protein K2O39_01360 [Clostridiales bacterium]|nr:hypothetical protein [Clostridiales bacterium]
MIHSMSGGVLSEYGTYTFVKVKFDGDERPYWYVCDFDVQEGDMVSAPFGVSGLGKPAIVLRVEHNVSGQVAPVPIKRAKQLLQKL